MSSLRVSLLTQGTRAPGSTTSVFGEIKTIRFEVQLQILKLVVHMWTNGVHHMKGPINIYKRVPFPNFSEQGKTPKKINEKGSKMAEKVASV